MLSYPRLAHWRFAPPADGQSGRTLSGKTDASTRFSDGDRDRSQSDGDRDRSQAQKVE
jgi:hypothetical protein